MNDPRVQLAVILLRIGVAFALAYAAIAAFIAPSNWIGFIPGGVELFMSASVALTIWSVAELMLAGWLLIGWRVRWPAILTALALLGLVSWYPSQIDILFRDVTIALAALALALLDR